MRLLQRAVQALLMGEDAHTQARYRCETRQARCRHDFCDWETTAYGATFRRCRLCDAVQYEDGSYRE
jgi:hypothetical protein